LLKVIHRSSKSESINHQISLRYNLRYPLSEVQKPSRRPAAPRAHCQETHISASSAGALKPYDLGFRRHPQALRQKNFLAAASAPFLNERGAQAFLNTQQHAQGFPSKAVGVLDFSYNQLYRYISICQHKDASASSSWEEHANLLL